MSSTGSVGLVYMPAGQPRLLIFPYTVAEGEYAILPERQLRQYKRVYKTLCDNRTALEARIWFGKRARELSGQWYGMMYLDSFASFSSPHILTPSLSNQSNFTIGQGTLFTTGTAGVTSIVLRSDAPEDIRYLLGLLNSRLLSFYVIAHSPIFSGGYHKFSAPYLKRIPIRRIDFSRPTEKAIHDAIVDLVAANLRLHATLGAAASAAQREVIRRQIDVTDAEIDRLVYQVFGITRGEVAIVEAR